MPLTDFRAQLIFCIKAINGNFLALSPKWSLRNKAILSWKCSSVVPTPSVPFLAKFYAALRFLCWILSLDLLIIFQWPSHQMFLLMSRKITFIFFHFLSLEVHLFKQRKLSCLRKNISVTGLFALNNFDSKYFFKSRLLN